MLADSCFYCAKDLGGKGHLDHVLPRSKYGDGPPENLVSACAKCNVEKRDRTPSEWLGTVPITELHAKALKLERQIFGLLDVWNSLSSAQERYRCQFARLPLHVFQLVGITDGAIVVIGPSGHRVPRVLRTNMPKEESGPSVSAFDSDVGFFELSCLRKNWEIIRTWTQEHLEIQIVDAPVYVIHSEIALCEAANIKLQAWTDWHARYERCANKYDNLKQEMKKLRRAMRGQ